MKPDNEFLLGLGERIRFARKSCKYTQKEFSEKLGVKQPNVCACEHGKVSLTGIQLLKVCELTGVSADWLLGLSERQVSDDMSPKSAFLLLFHYIKGGVSVGRLDDGRFVISMDSYSSEAQAFIEILSDMERFCSGGTKMLSPDMLSEFESSWSSRMSDKYGSKKAGQ